MVHELKILPEYFEAVDSLHKQFELRKNDRDYKVGDFLLLKEFEEGTYTSLLELLIAILTIDSL